MSKKLAPPGRKGSVKREAFKADEGKIADAIVAEEIPQPAQDGQASEQAERARQEELRARQEAEAKAAAEAAAKEEQLRAQQEAARRQTEAEQAKKRAEEQQRLEAAKAQETAEAAARKQAEDEAAAAMEAMAIVAERQRQAEEAARRKYEEETAAARKAAEEEAARRRTQEAAAEQERQRQEEEAAKRRTEEAAAAKLRAEEEAAAAAARALAAAEQRRKEDDEARLQAEASAAAERRRLEEEKRRELDDELQRLAREEAARIEAERTRVAEEANRAAAALQAQREAELETKRRQAEEQRRKRAAFLSQMSNFTDDFETRTVQREEELKETEQKRSELEGHVNVIETSLKEKSAQPIVVPVVEPPPPVVVSVPLPPPEPVPAPAPIPYKSASTAAAMGTAVPTKDLLQDLTASLFAERRVQSDPFSLEETAPSSSPAFPETTATAASKGLGETEELRVPTRIGREKKKEEGTSPAPEAKPRPAPTTTLPLAGPGLLAATVATASTSTSSAAAAPFLAPVSPPISLSNPVAGTASPPPAAATTPISDGQGDQDPDDVEEEGTGTLDSISNILTIEERRRLTVAEKASWRAKQADLHTRRKAFHGAVTYMFDGIFSWQMYGSAEAIDEFGNTYTEYLMRCQWGSTFENLQPWIVAHRYKEFDKLDQDLKRQFPQFEKNMPKLPKKELFRTLDSNVVARRRAVLEDYMAKLVTSMPTLLRSDVMDVFLRIQERIGTIKNLLNWNHPVPLTMTTGSVVSVEEGGILSQGEVLAVQDPLSATRRTSRSLRAGEDIPETKGGDREEEEEEVSIWTMDEAEEVKNRLGSAPLDEDALGRFEEDLRAFTSALKTAKRKDIVRSEGQYRQAVKSLTRRWPGLRATAVVNMGVDFSLIPRAMQAEEDLVHAINEFRNWEAIRSMM